MKSINLLKHSIFVFFFLLSINIFATVSTPSYSPDGKSGSLTLLAADCQGDNWNNFFAINIPANVPVNITLTTNTYDGIELWTNSSFYYDTYYKNTYTKTIISTDGILYLNSWDGYYGLPTGNVFTLTFAVDVASPLTTASAYVPGYFGVGTATPAKKFEVWDGNAGKFTFSAANCTSGYEIAQTIDDTGYRLNVGSTIRDYKIAVNGLNKFAITNTGNVGIGTIAPTEILDIKGNVNLNNQYSPTTGSLNPGYYVYKYGITSYGMKLQYTDGKYGTMIFGPNQSNRFIGFGKVGAELTDSQIIEYMRVDLNNGYVGIGTKTPDQALTVKGKIHANEVIIDVLYPIVPDFVFKPSYRLMPLNQVEEYVKSNNHLPDVPSATEVSKNGMSIGEMQNKLLQKIEELTLYVIEQQKTNNQQSAKIEELERKLK